MKRFTILSIALVAALSSCQRNLDLGNQNPSTDENAGIIRLSVNGAYLGSRASNEGIRVGTFEEGDQISVSAFLRTHDGADQPVFDAQDWTTPAYFENKPALFSAVSQNIETISLFNWGADGSGGGNSMYYPSQNRYISLMAYYPNADVAPSLTYVPSDVDAASDEERQPKLQIELLDDTHVLAEGSELAAPYFAQPDVLRYVSDDPINRQNLSQGLHFTHVLAQIRFTVILDKGATPKEFKKIEFKTVKSAEVNLFSGLFAYASVPVLDEAVYTIELPTGASNLIPEDNVDPQVNNALDVLNPENAENFNYPMVFPLTTEMIKGGSISLQMSDIGAPDEEITTLEINLDNFKGQFESGKQNTLAIRITGTEIALEASIEDWAEGNTDELLAE